MKTVRFHTTGGPEVLVYENVPDPTPKDGEVLIRIEAAGMNFANVMRRRGDNYPVPSPTPFTLGVEVAGTIVAVGKGVTSVEVGSLYGQSSGKTALIDPWRLTTPNHSVIGFYIGAYLAFPDLIQSTFAEIIGYIMAGKLELQVGTVLPLSQAGEAHRLLEGRKTTGKVVLQPWVNA